MLWKITKLSAQLSQLIQASPQLRKLIRKHNSHKIHSNNYKLETKYLYGNKNTNYFDSMMPIMINFIVFFFVFLISEMSLFGERNRGTLGRVLATPIRKIELITGYVLGYGLFAIIQTVEIVVFTIYIFKLEVIGNIGLIILINLLVACSIKFRNITLRFCKFRIPNDAIYPFNRSSASTFLRNYPNYYNAKLVTMDCTYNSAVLRWKLYVGCNTKGL